MNNKEMANRVIGSEARGILHSLIENKKQSFEKRTKADHPDLLDRIHFTLGQIFKKDPSTSEIEKGSLENTVIKWTLALPVKSKNDANRISTLIEIIQDAYAHDRFAFVEKGTIALINQILRFPENERLKELVSAACQSPPHCSMGAQILNKFFALSEKKYKTIEQRIEFYQNMNNEDVFLTRYPSSALVKDQMTSEIEVLEKKLALNRPPNIVRQTSPEKHKIGS
jgi:hypothetical protein